MEVGHVGEDGVDPLGRIGAQRLARVVERLQLDVGDHDPAAGGEERTGEAEPDPTGAAGDHRDLVLELVHAIPLGLRGW